MIDLAFNDYYSEELYMTADIETGVLYNRAGRRMLALTDDFLIGLHRALEKECSDRAPQVLYTCGKRWGTNFAIGLDQEWSEFYKAPVADFPLAMLESLVVQEFGHNGWGLLEFDFQYWNRGLLALSLDGAIMADLLGNTAVGPADILTAGIFSGMFSHFMGDKLGCLQTESSAQNSESTAATNRFLLTAEARINALGDVAMVSKDSHHAIVEKLLATNT